MDIFQQSPCQFYPGCNSHPVIESTGDAGNGHAREMGCLRLRSKRRVGPSDLDFVMPKVKEVRVEVMWEGGVAKSHAVISGVIIYMYIYIHMYLHMCEF